MGLFFEERATARPRSLPAAVEGSPNPGDKKAENAELGW